IEVTWDITRDIDLDDKVLHYHRAGVPFYAIVDTRPGEAHPRVRLIGYRWSPDGYVRVAPDPSGRLWLEAVRLWLAGEGNALVCYDQRGRRVPTYQELLKTFQARRAVVERAEKQAEEASEHRRALVARFVELQAELRRLRGEG